MKQMVCVRNGKVVINGLCVDLPKPSKSVNVTQCNGRVFVNGFEWTESGWKRTIAAIWHNLF